MGGGGGGGGVVDIMRGAYVFMWGAFVFMWCFCSYDLFGRYVTDVLLSLCGAFVAM